jgi:hypothetical protein
MIKVTRLPGSLTGFYSPLKRFFSPAQWQHFRFLILVICVVSGRRTIRNLRNGLSHRHSHRTNLHDFVIQADWDPIAVLQKATLELLKRLKPQDNERLYLIIDDTKIEKRGTRMDALGQYHDTAKKHITGHDVVSAVLLFRGLVLPWALDLHEPKKKARRCRPSARRPKSKEKRPFVKTTERAARMIESFPKLPWCLDVVVLFDSFYLCSKVIKACKNRGFVFVSRAKKNRKIFVRSGKREYSTNVSKRGSLLFRKRRHIQTIRGGAQGTRKFRVIGEVGRLSKVGNVKLVFSQEYQRSRKIVCLVTNDTKMTNRLVLDAYAHRWWIEVFFKEVKQHLGLSDYQTGHYEGIQKHLYLVAIAFALLTHVRLDGRRAKGKREKNLLAPVAVKTSCDLLRQVVLKNELRSLAPRKKATRATFLIKLEKLFWKCAA